MLDCWTPVALRNRDPDTERDRACRTDVSAPYPSSTMETLRSEAMKRSQAAIIAAEEILIDIGLQA